MVGATIEINLNFVRDNYLLFRRIGGQGSNCIPVVKANAYGLGIFEVVDTLSRMDDPQRDFFVYSLESACDLRLNFGDRLRNIYVLRGLVAGQERIFLEQAITPVINSREQLEIWSSCGRALARKLDTVLQFNVGINRSGIEMSLAEQLRDFVSDRENMINLTMAMGHLGCQCPLHSPLGQRYTRVELENFKKIASLFPDSRKCLLESRGVLQLPEALYDCSRIGIGLFTFEREKNAEIKTVFTLRCALERDERSGECYINFGTENGLAESYGDGGFVQVDGRRVAVKKLQSQRTLLDLEDAGVLSEALLVGHLGENHIDGYEFSRMNGTIPEEFFAQILVRNRDRQGVKIEFIGNGFDRAKLKRFGPLGPPEIQLQFDSVGRLVRLEATVSEKRIVEEDGFCGYDATESVRRGDALVTISIGYLDGFSRRLSGTGVKLSIENSVGRIFPCILCGRVSMDQICARVSERDFGEIEIGNRVLLVNSSAGTGAELAAALDTALLRARWLENLAGESKRVLVLA
ncbi:MAG: alanine racemase [Rickettsiales bacterium]|jgi:alanine racemase|nr:alanine racemase [Rickettsiales bacterium]